MVTEFVHLGSKAAADGDCGLGISTMISKDSKAFSMLMPIWQPTYLYFDTKIKTFKSNVLGVLLYGSEWQKTTTITEQELEVHHLNLFAQYFIGLMIQPTK